MKNPVAFYIALFFSSSLFAGTITLTPGQKHIVGEDTIACQSVTKPKPITFVKCRFSGTRWYYGKIDNVTGEADRSGLRNALESACYSCLHPQYGGIPRGCKLDECFYENSGELIDVPTQEIRRLDRLCH